MNWQYLQLEAIARQRVEMLMSEAAQERLLEELRSREKSEEHTRAAVKPAWMHFQWLGLPRHAS